MPNPTHLQPLTTRSFMRSMPPVMARQVGSRAISPYFRLGTADAANLLDGLVSVDLGQLNRRGISPGSFLLIKAIQEGKVRYRRRDPREHWKTWDELMAPVLKGGMGFGDCEDLSSGVAAELSRSGIPARTYVYQSGPKLYHVVVKTEKWGLLDPSRDAGMQGNG
jgi:hypothetical protein